ncbi:MAG TPA: hypothetical protein VL025_19650 [Thermoanaerobaculia bacterium]|nr:hypothetical protein [Thermoanaerobaculia bacterium]
MPPKDDLQGLREILREAVAALRLPTREIEDRLGLGHSTLKKILDGEIDLRVRHLLALARLLDIHPRDFLDLGLSDWPARHNLREWLSPDHRKSAQPTEISGELAEAIRALVREEIAAASLPPAPKTPRKK